MHYKRSSHPIIVRHRQPLVKQDLATQPMTEMTGYYRLHYEWMCTSGVNGIWVQDLNLMTTTGHKVKKLECSQQKVSQVLV
jgi:hypothetical protein